MRWDLIFSIFNHLQSKNLLILNAKSILTDLPGGSKCLSILDKTVFEYLPLVRLAWNFDRLIYWWFATFWVITRETTTDRSGRKVQGRVDTRSTLLPRSFFFVSNLLCIHPDRVFLADSESAFIFLIRFLHQKLFKKYRSFSRNSF